jgi:magnesium-transporting ATPase (P-type)
MPAGPQRWNIGFIRKFMVTFGMLCSVFDFLTFGVLLFILKVGAAQLRTGWFVESAVSACLIVLVIRSRRPFFRIMPSRLPLLSTHGVVGLAILMPFTPLSAIFDTAARVELSREYITFLQRRIPDIVEQFIDLGGTVIALAFYDKRIAITCSCIAIPLILMNRLYKKKVIQFQK